MSRARPHGRYVLLPEPLAEPQPIVRAFASGMAVIACRSGVAPELVEHRRNGLLFAPGSERELARLIAWAEAFPERMRRMGECAKADYLARLAAHFTYPRLFGERRRAFRP